MEPLSLTLVGWLFTGLSVIALALGALTIMAMHRSGERERQLLARTVLNDALLFGIWILGLAAGIGVLRLEPWSRGLMEFFCWVLIPLVIVATLNRVLVTKREHDAAGERMPWLPALAGAMVIAGPLIALSAGTIYTMRSEVAQAAFAR
jgi:hypothetical protein